VACRNGKHFFSQFITQRGTGKKTHGTQTAEKEKPKSDLLTTKHSVGACPVSPGPPGAAAESSRPALGLSDLQLQQNTVINGTQRNGGGRMRRPSHNSKKHQSA